MITWIVGRFDSLAKVCPPTADLKNKHSKTARHQAHFRHLLREVQDENDASEESFYDLSLAALAACSGPPSVGDIKEQLESALARESLGMITMTMDNFEKVNGFEKDEKTYVAHVKFDLIVKDAGQPLPVQDSVTLIETEKGWVLTEWHPNQLIPNALGALVLKSLTKP